ncbi:MAG: isoprenoid biosynthesis glyoxalase ElbB [Bacteroidales bacterium]|jgi:enhancing lycopene biosynthesis protein 2|nr:isoprenoid biosynthesis glyoxalase ElbB [Bacteroidales bacterium]
MKKIAIVLAGNGVFDGAEIQEATLTMYSIVKNGATYEIFAPNIEHHHVINHITGEEMSEKRNVLVEAARIARGKISDLAEFKASNFDALIFPGGFGVAKNLCSFAFDGIECTINSEVENAIKNMIELKKPIGALCIAPVLLAKILKNVELTIGQDKDTAQAINAMGSKHIDTTHGELVIDENYKIITTPCYMLDANISQIADGANNVVKTILNLCA